MRTLAKIFGASVMVFLGFEFSAAQVGNANGNPPPAQQQPAVSQQQNPPAPNNPNQPNVLSPNQPMDGAYKQSIILIEGLFHLLLCAKRMLCGKHVSGELLIFVKKLTSNYITQNNRMETGLVF